MHTANVLLVEDNPADQRLVLEAFREVNPLARLFIVDDGLKALHFLRREPPYNFAPSPDLIILDLNLPRKDGREFLAEVKLGPKRSSVPIVVFTTSSAAHDIEQTYALHANCFVNKPLHLDAFLSTIRAICHFWLRTAQLPRELELL